MINMTSHGDRQNAVEAMKAGFLDYIVKSHKTLCDLPHSADRGPGTMEVMAQRKQAVRTLKKNEESLQTITENSPGLIFLKDLDGRYLYGNRHFTEVFRLAKKHVIGKTDQEVFAFDQANALQAHDQGVKGSQGALGI